MQKINTCRSKAQDVGDTLRSTFKSMDVWLAKLEIFRYFPDFLQQQQKKNLGFPWQHICMDFHCR